MKYIYIFVTIVIMRFLYYLFKYLNNDKLYKIWKQYFYDLINKKPNSKAITYTKAIENNFKSAKIKNSLIPIAQPIGYWQIATSQAKSFDNIFVNDKRVMPYINEAFLQTAGVFREKMFESFNPFYWIKLIIFLPKNIISYLGLNVETIFTKLFQLIYWFIDTFLIFYYRDDIFSGFQAFFSNLFK